MKKVTKPKSPISRRKQKTTGSSELKLRLIRDDDVPASHRFDEPYLFGLQDTKQQIFAGTRDAKGRFIFDFSVSVKPGSNGKQPSFTGRFASGTPSDRFVYLSWFSVPRKVWINRVKARLSSIDWAMVRAAQKADGMLVADMTGRGPGDPRKHVEWRLAQSARGCAAAISPR
jgi:hypothetical protein